MLLSHDKIYSRSQRVCCASTVDSVAKIGAQPCNYQQFQDSPSAGLSRPPICLGLILKVIIHRRPLTLRNTLLLPVHLGDLSRRGSLIRLLVVADLDEPREP